MTPGNLAAVRLLMPPEVEREAQAINESLRAVDRAVSMFFARWREPLDHSSAERRLSDKFVRADEYARVIQRALVDSWGRVQVLRVRLADAAAAAEEGDTP